MDVLTIASLIAAAAFALEVVRLSWLLHREREAVSYWKVIAESWAKQCNQSQQQQLRALEDADYRREARLEEALMVRAVELTIEHGTSLPAGAYRPGKFAGDVPWPTEQISEKLIEPTTFRGLKYHGQEIVFRDRYTPGAASEDDAMTKRRPSSKTPRVLFRCPICAAKFDKYIALTIHQQGCKP